MLKGHPSTNSTILSQTSVGNLQDLGQLSLTSLAHQSRRWQGTIPVLIMRLLGLNQVKSEQSQIPWLALFGEAEWFQLRLESIREHNNPTLSQRDITNMLYSWVDMFSAIGLFSIQRSREIVFRQRSFFWPDTTAETECWRLRGGHVLR